MLIGVTGAKPSPVSWTLSEDASVVKISSRPDRYAFQLLSWDSQGILGSGISYSSTQPLTFEQVTELSCDYAAVEGGIGGGSPRWAIGIDVDGNGVFQQGVGGDGYVFVYFGPVDNGFHEAPSDAWSNTGNLMAATDNRFDCNQLGSTNYYDNYATALSLAGGKRVMKLFLVIDSGWLFDQQEVLVNNLRVNGSVLTAKKP